MRVGGNVILLKHALREKGFPERGVADMNKIIEVQEKDFIVKDIAHAKRLVQSYQEAQAQLVLPN